MDLIRPPPPQKKPKIRPFKSKTGDQNGRTLTSFSQTLTLSILSTHKERTRAYLIVDDQNRGGEIELIILMISSSNLTKNNMELFESKVFLVIWSKLLVLNNNMVFFSSSKGVSLSHKKLCFLIP